MWAEVNMYSLIYVLLKYKLLNFLKKVSLEAFSHICLIYWNDNYGEMKLSTFYNSVCVLENFKQYGTEQTSHLNDWRLIRQNVFTIM